jgi:ankyrin repeat protein
VDTIDGYYVTSAVAALAGRHFELAKVLHRHKSSVEPRGYFDNTPLHSAAACGDLEMVQVLLEYGVDANAQNRFRRTPLDFALLGGHHNRLRVARLLIEPEHGRREDRDSTLNNRGWRNVDVKYGEGTTP